MMGFWRNASSVFLVVVIIFGFPSIHNVLGNDTDDTDDADDVDTCSADEETCAIPDVEVCEDKDELCSFWAEEHDECDKNPDCKFGFA
jgi:hypothetical protein